jgi:hypothetical protein
VKKLISIILILTLFTYLCGCQKPQTYNHKENISEINYIVTERPETQARTKISVIDGKVYCMWVDVKYNNEGRTSETYVLDVFENGGWKNVSKQVNDFNDSPYFEKSFKFPLNEKIGNKTVYTNSVGDFYIYDDINKETYDLKINLKEWRMFATDNENVFAVLSAYATKDSNSEIRIYNIS